jgi:hypothetical protein
VSSYVECGLRLREPSGSERLQIEKPRISNQMSEIKLFGILFKL